MKRIVHGIKIILYGGCIAALHIFIKESNFFPLAYLHIVFIAAMWLTLYYSSPRALWIAIVPMYIVELFSSSPWGIATLSLLLALSVMSWLLIRIFTNHSLLIVGLSGIVGMFLYRIVFIILELFFSVLLHQEIFSFSREIGIEWILEIIFTAGGLTILYGITAHFSKRLKPHYVASIR